MFVYRNHRPDKKIVLFDYQQTRQAQWPKQILKDFKGYLQTDGYKGYDWVDDHPDIIHLGCFAHARRPFALGRKNWLFSGSHRGDHASALFYSLIATAKANGLNPFDYLKTLFKNIRSCKTAEDYRALLPFNLTTPN
ncbi:IS66 family transposase [Legionella quateirensis]|nr:transposase [Legionella quateirensis]